MDLSEFEALAEPLHRKSAASVADHGFTLVDGRTATSDEIAWAERKMGLAFPEKYKTFMTRYGGGAFGYVDLFPIAVEPQNDGDDLLTMNDREFPDRSFLAVAPVGTGDHWGFPVIAGRCEDQVWFHFHDAGDDEFVAADFLEFVAKHGLEP